MKFYPYKKGGGGGKRFSHAEVFLSGRKPVASVCSGGVMNSDMSVSMGPHARIRDKSLHLIQA